MSWVAWWVTSWRVREMTVFIVSRIFGACGWLHYTLRKTQFQLMLNSIYNALVWGHSKMSSPHKCQMLDPPPSLCHSYFCHYTSSPQVTRQIVTNFSMMEDLKKWFTYLAELICNWRELNRSTNEPTTCLKIYNTCS